MALISFEEIYSNYDQYIINLIRGFKHSYNVTLVEQDIDDIRQYCYEKIYNSLEQYEGLCNPKSYVWHIVRSCFINYLKSKEYKDNCRTVGIDDIELFHDNGSNPNKIVSKLDREERITTIKEIVKQLPDQQQLIFKLRFLDGYNQTEIAKILDLRQSTISEHESRIRKYLHDEIIKKFGDLDY